MTARSVVFWIAAALVASPALAAQPTPAAPKAAQQGTGCPRNAEVAMWYSIAHPGLGEWYLNGWGSLARNAPPNKFWLGFIPVFGWPGYLQVRSAIDARHCRTHDWPK